MKFGKIFLCSGSLHRHRKVWLRLSRTPWFVCFFLCLMPSHPFSLPPTLFFFFKPMTPFYSLLHLASDCSLSVHCLPIAGVHGDGGRGDRGLEHDTVFGWKPFYLMVVSLFFFILSAKVSRGDSFFVPPHNTYNLLNLSSTQV